MSADAWSRKRWRHDQWFYQTITISTDMLEDESGIGSCNINNLVHSNDGWNYIRAELILNFVLEMHIHAWRA